MRDLPEEMLVYELGQKSMSDEDCRVIEEELERRRLECERFVPVLHA